MRNIVWIILFIIVFGLLIKFLPFIIGVAALYGAYVYRKKARVVQKKPILSYLFGVVGLFFILIGIAILSAPTTLPAADPPKQAIKQESSGQKKSEVNKEKDPSAPVAVKEDPSAKPEAPKNEPTEKKKPEENTISTGMEATVVEVTDGDTLVVKLGNREEKVRLLLVDTPETVHPSKPVQPFGLEASKFAKEILDGQTVGIEIDVSERDKYGRLLAYVWIGDKMFNEMLLEKGLARVAYIYPPNTKYVDQFQSIQETAQKAGVGIWSIENYAQEDGFQEPVEKPAVANKPTTTPKPAPAPKPTPKPSENVYYKNCSEVRAAGADPIHEGEPGYSRKLDRDGDGVGCE